MALPGHLCRAAIRTEIHTAMSRKKHGVKYNLVTAESTKVRDYRLKKGFKVNPFANGYKNMTPQEFVAKETSEKYRRIKK